MQDRLLKILQLLAILAVSALPLYAEESNGWTKRSEDLESLEISVDSGFFFSSRINLFRTSLSKFKIGVIRAQAFGLNRTNVRALCQASKGLLCINANFFDENGKPLGLIVARGITHQKIHQRGNTLTGIFQATRSDIAIVTREMFNPHPVVEAIQAGPRLVSNGNPVAGLRESSSSRRSGVCIDKDGRLIFYIVSSSFLGMSIGDLQTVLTAKQVSCVDALNLDGGGSSQLYLSGDLPGAPPQDEEFFVEGSDDVPIALGLFPTKE